MSFLIFLTFSLLSLYIFLPSKYTSPSVGSKSLNMVFTNVDLPQPDSPTIPKTSPFFISKLTPSTAFNVRPLCFFKGSFISKYFFKFSTFNIISSLFSSFFTSFLTSAASTSSFVYSCSGLFIKPPVSPCSIIFPPHNIPTLSQKADTRLKLFAIKRTVILYFFCNSLRSLSMLA
ncbi:hypothetical protein SDC9_126254 [bioreactor metagenome]|uniref:Uncharacterized protein n=1 Tax=bioreactor metagenome TaxID=1076179 RepID=A0A645CQL9_9ZZZZ